jgi:hypothetical protein
MATRYKISEYCKWVTAETTQRAALADLAGHVEFVEPSGRRWTKDRRTFAWVSAWSPNSSSFLSLETNNTMWIHTQHDNGHWKRLYGDEWNQCGRIRVA